MLAHKIKLVSMVAAFKRKSVPMVNSSVRAFLWTPTQTAVTAGLVIRFAQKDRTARVVLVRC